MRSTVWLYFDKKKKKKREVCICHFSFLFDSFALNERKLATNQASEKVNEFSFRIHNIKGYCSIASICTWEQSAIENSKVNPKITNRHEIHSQVTVRLIQLSLVEFCRLHTY